RAHELVHLHQVVRDHHHDRDRGAGLDHRLGPGRRPLHRADRGTAAVRAVPDGSLLASPDRDHDRAAAGDSRAPRAALVLRAPPSGRARASAGRGLGAGPVALLDLSGVTMRFGGLVAVNELDLSLEPGQLYGLIGPNGAGQTTGCNALPGVYR